MLPTPTAVIPKVQVNVLEARGLAQKLLGIIAKRDPYFTIELGEVVYRGKTCPKTLDPTWNQTFELYVILALGSHIARTHWLACNITCVASMSL
jgi:Ca2+-dependent lipid-binding protein